MAINVSLQQLLSSPTITRVISRVKTPQTRLQEFFGMQPGGPATNPAGGSVHAYDIFDKTRKLATGRSRGTGPATIAPNKVGQITVTLYRSHEKIPLLDEKLFRTRPLGSNWGNVDARGMAYITKQEEYLAQRFKNMREFMCAQLFKGGFGISFSGEDVVPVAIDAGHKNVEYFGPSNEHNGQTSSAIPGLTIGGQADIIGASWATASTDIINDVLQINAGFEEVHGRPFRHVWLNSTTFAPLMENTQLASAAGSANTIFNNFGPTDYRSIDGIPDTGLEFIFKAIPWLKWHIYDAGLDVNGTFTKFFPDNYAAFCPDPSSDWAEWVEGSEIVRENLMDQGSERFGMTAWTTPCIDPSGFELKALDNGIPCLYVPKCLAYAKIS